MAEEQIVNAKSRIQDIVILEINAEIDRAKTKHGEKIFNSTHEGYAVLKEEVDELWQDIKNDTHLFQMRREAVQVAAMAIRFIQELT